MAAYNGALSGWKQAGPVPLELTVQQRRYLDAWQTYTGELFERTVDPKRADPTLYQHTKLLWKHVEAVVDFYAGVIYQGALPGAGAELPSTALSAIPIKTQIENETKSEQLMTAIRELFAAWNWQQQMSLRPMYGAVLGDCLTELVDDPERRFVYPQTVWPGYVTQIELDYVGNVRSYTLEYQVTEKRHLPGIYQVGSFTSETYRYRKEVDGDEFRYFKDDKPFDYGAGSVVENPYGFVPAIWDRHRIGAPGDPRGRSAIEGTRQALLQLNSIFSHAFDFQRKAFFAPIMVAGKGASKSSSDKTHDVTSAPNTFDVVGVPDGASLLQPEFDIGKTSEMLDALRKGIVDENPEARFYQEMREMQMVTAPGAERLMGDVKNRVDLARSGYDSQTIKLFQMAISMCGMRAHGSEWRTGDNGQRIQLDRRRQVFAPFDLTSFERGDLAFTIEPRPIVFPTEQERIDIVLQKESLQTRWGLEQAGMDETIADEIL
ncbi:MAG: hypothetical protein KC438_14870, partial [Thermomicrobiales bacterium]|nr:hypothetical protein [Thermomicrobiales bacterium]